MDKKRNKKRIMIGIVIAAAAVLCISLFLNGPKSPSGSSGAEDGEPEIVNAGQEDDDDPIVETRPEELRESAENKNEAEKPSGSERKEEEEEVSSGSSQEKNTQAKEEKKPEKESDQENKEEQQEGNSSEGEPIQGDDAWTDYDTFLAKSPAEQDAFMKNFDSPEAFDNWLVKAQKEWAAAHPSTEIGPDGVIDFGR